LLDEIRDADPEPVDEAHEPADGDVALPLLDRREEGRRDPRALRDLREGDAARPPELAKPCAEVATRRLLRRGRERLHRRRVLCPRHAADRSIPWRSRRISASCATTSRCQRSSSIDGVRQAVSITRLPPGSPTSSPATTRALIRRTSRSGSLPTS